MTYWRLKHFKRCGYDVCDENGMCGRPGMCNIRVYPMSIHPDDRPAVYLLAIAIKLGLRAAC